MSDDFLVHFRGVRGSIPTPPRPSQIKDKVKKVLELASADDIKDVVSKDFFNLFHFIYMDSSAVILLAFK